MTVRRTLAIVLPVTALCAKSASSQSVVVTRTAIYPSFELYNQALVDLGGENRLSWRGPAIDLHEALRETLDHLAPDASVMDQPSFKLEKGVSAPTMKQKVRFILRKRGVLKNATKSPEAATRLLKRLLGAL